MQKDEINEFKTSQLYHDIKRHAKDDFNLDFSELMDTQKIDEFFYSVFENLNIVFPETRYRFYFESPSKAIDEIEVSVKKVKELLKDNPELFEKIISILRHFINTRNFDRAKYRSVRILSITNIEETPELKKINGLLDSFIKPKSSIVNLFSFMSFSLQAIKSTITSLPKILLFTAVNMTTILGNRSADENEEVDMAMDSAESGYSFFSMGSMPEIKAKPDSVAYHVLQDQRGLLKAGFSPFWMKLNSIIWTSTIKELIPTLTKWSKTMEFDWELFSTEELQQLVSSIQKRASKIVQAFPAETDPFVKAVQGMPQINVSSKITLATPEYGPTVWIFPNMAISYVPLCNSILCRDVFWRHYKNQPLEIRPLLISERDLAPSRIHILEQRLTNYVAQQLTSENQDLYATFLTNYFTAYAIRYQHLSLLLIPGDFGMDESLGIHFSKIFHQILENCLNIETDQKLQSTLKKKLGLFKKEQKISSEKFEILTRAKTRKLVENEIYRVLTLDPSLSLEHLNIIRLRQIVDDDKSKELYQRVKGISPAEVRIEQVSGLDPYARQPPRIMGDFDIRKEGIAAIIKNQTQPYQKTQNIKVLTKRLQEEYVSTRKNHQQEIDNSHQYIQEVVGKVNSVEIGRKVLKFFTILSNGDLIFVDNLQAYPGLKPYHDEYEVVARFSYETESIYITKDPEFIRTRLRDLPLAILTVDASVLFAHQLLLSQLLHGFCYFVGQQQASNPDLPKDFFGAPYWRMEEKTKFAAARKSDREHIVFLLTLGREVLKKTSLKETDKTKWKQFITDLKLKLPHFRQEKFKRLGIQTGEPRPELNRVISSRSRIIMNEIVMVDSSHWLYYGKGHVIPGPCDNSVLVWCEEIHDYTLDREQLDALAVNFLNIAYVNMVSIIEIINHPSVNMEDSEVFNRYGNIVMALGSEELVELVVPCLKQYVDEVFAKYGMPLMKSKYFADLHLSEDNFVRTDDAEISFPVTQLAGSPSF